MPILPYLADTAAIADAQHLIETFGLSAGDEAAARADRSRGLGNVVRFCHWRQIERLIEVLVAPCAMGTVH